MKKLITAVSVMFLSTVILTGCVGSPTAPTTSPEEMVKDAFANSMDVKSHSYKATIDADVTVDEQSLTGTMTLEGEQDMSVPEAPKFTMAIEFSGATADYPEQSGKAELMMDEDVVYFVLKSITDFDGNLPEELVAAFLGQWYFMPLPEDSLSQLAIATDEEMLEEAKQLFMDHFFLTNIEYSGTEGSDYKYTADFDKEEFIEYMKASAELSEQVVTEAELTQMREGLDAVEIDSVLYIDSEKVLLSGWDGAVTFDVEGNNGTVDFEIGMSDFDKAVSIDVPDGAVEFNPMMLLGPAMMMQPGMEDLEIPEEDLDAMMLEMEGFEEELMMEVGEMPEL